ncbi:MAG: hypothetical protein EOM87_00200 [Clostridia bacterium]|nr:hypothetical protein [Clostridia bacterium]
MKKAIRIIVLTLIIALLSIIVAACATVDHTLNFDVDGDIYYTLTPGDKEVISLPDAPHKEGYEFIGWFFDKDVWNQPFTKASFLNAPISSDMTVYAMWLPEEKHSVTFITNGGTWLSPVEASKIETNPITSRDFRTFIGWYAESNLNESTKVEFPLQLTDDITLYAKWSDATASEYLSLYFATSTNSYVVIGYFGSETSIIIPSTYRGFPVTSIGDNAFLNKSSIEEVIIPDSVTHIGYLAFSGTSWYNNQLDGLVYAGKTAYKYKGKMPSDTSIELLSDTKSISSNAFFNCPGLISITIPDSVERIGDFAFSWCAGLTSIAIPDSVTSIGSNAFLYCSGLVLIAIPESVTYIGDSAFAECSGLTAITVDVCNPIFKSENNCLIEVLTNKLILGCNNSIIPDGVTSIGDSAFRECNGLTAIIIPDTVTNIGRYAFYGCNGITSIIIPDIVTTIGDHAFSECSGLTAFIIPNSVKSIGNYAFSYCHGLTSITIPKSVISIGNGAFYKCSGLTSVVFIVTSWYRADSPWFDTGTTVTAQNPITNATSLVNNCGYRYWRYDN